MPGYMYILRCSDGTYYVGSTKNLTRRLNEHMSGIGGAKYTQKRLPVKLMYFEYYEHVYLAYRRERQIHNWSHKKKTALIEMEYDMLHYLAECKNESHYRNFKKRIPSNECDISREEIIDNR